MLSIKVSQIEVYNEETREFLMIGGKTIELEHSLVSLSKWESKFQKPFLSSTEKTQEEIYAYIEMMIVSDCNKKEVLSELSTENIKQINDYIDSKESATTFRETRDNRQSRKTEIITSELIYYWMISFNIPFECQTWHLNRLFALIRICGIKNSKPKKMSKTELAQRNRELNEQRRQQYGTKG